MDRQEPVKHIRLQDLYDIYLRINIFITYVLLLLLIKQSQSYKIITIELVLFKMIM